MRIAITGTLAAALALLQAGCGKVGPPPPAAAERPSGSNTARMASTVQVADPKMAAQLVSGFHGVESGSWRWTERQFTVALGVPAGADQTGGTLELRLTVPPQSIEKLNSLTLTATIAGTDLGPETYSKPGPYIYKREVPARLLPADPVKVAFTLDKAMKPGGADLRELGVVVTSIGLAPK
jgi:hypothetical protein